MNQLNKFMKKKIRLLMIIKLNLTFQEIKLGGINHPKSKE